MASLEVIRAKDLYHMEDEMLSTYWHFSFDHYRDPDRMGYGHLRVFNDDTVKPGGGWGMHPHRDMEIITYVVEGQIEHRDSSGGGGVVKAGEVQRMSAGTGIMHSESNPSREEALRLLQIWIIPDRRGYAPTYETKHFTKADQQGKLLPVVSGRPMKGVGRIHQDATIYVGGLGGGTEVSHDLKGDRLGYFFTVKGDVNLEGKHLGELDVAHVPGGMKLHLSTPNRAEVMLVDLPNT